MRRSYPRVLAVPQRAMGGVICCGSLAETSSVRGAKGSWPLASQPLLSSRPASPAESALLSVFVQLAFSHGGWPAALSRPLPLPPASASSSPGTLAGLSLTTGRGSSTASCLCRPCTPCTGRAQSEGNVGAHPARRPWPETLPISWRVCMAQLPLTSHQTDPAPPAPSSKWGAQGTDSSGPGLLHPPLML